MCRSVCPTARCLRWALLALVLALLGACASGPARPSRPAQDGPGANPPPGLAAVPDAEPRVESPRRGGPNKPYEVLGRSYTPLTGDPPLHETGAASWYGRKFQGLPTSSGEPYDMYAMTAAHKTMPIPSYARVRNPANGREVIVRINDRGPFAPGRIIDLSYTAALKLGLLRGVAPVEVERLTNDEIRAGTWRRDTSAPMLASAAAAPAAAAPSLPASSPPSAPPTQNLASAPAASMAAADAAARPEPAPVGTVSAVSAASVTPAEAGAASPGFWLQLGAFRRAEGAAALRERVQRDAGWLASLLAVFSGDSLLRVQAGPFGSRAAALAASERLRAALSIAPLLLERR